MWFSPYPVSLPVGSTVSLLLGWPNSDSSTPASTYHTTFRVPWLGLIWVVLHVLWRILSLQRMHQLSVHCNVRSCDVCTVDLSSWRSLLSQCHLWTEIRTPLYQSIIHVMFSCNKTWLFLCLCTHNVGTAERAKKTSAADSKGESWHSLLSQCHLWNQDTFLSVPYICNTLIHAIVPCNKTWLFLCLCTCNAERAKKTSAADSKGEAWHSLLSQCHLWNLSVPYTCNAPIQVMVPCHAIRHDCFCVYALAMQEKQREPRRPVQTIVKVSVHNADKQCTPVLFGWGETCCSAVYTSNLWWIEQWLGETSVTPSLHSTAIIEFFRESEL